ncbi:hypothetical protein ACB092_02G008400, partial [Castanea dentata]
CPNLLLLLLLLWRCVATITVVPKVNGCEIAVISGGCPDIKTCLVTCRPCYRGVGMVNVYCGPAGGGIPFDQCICRISRGAPCSPVGPPHCP